MEENAEFSTVRKERTKKNTSESQKTSFENLTPKRPFRFFGGDFFLRGRNRDEDDARVVFCARGLQLVGKFVTGKQTTAAFPAR